jgi:site-specific recombinase XerD
MNRNAVEQLITKTSGVIRRKHLSWRTEECYLGWIRRYAHFADTLARKLSSEAKVEAFLTRLAKDGVAASTQNQAFNALLFFYEHGIGKPLQNIHALRAKRPATVRTAPSEADVRAALEAVQDIHGYPTRLVAALLYGCGLRVTEPLNLRIKDVDLEGSRLVIRGAKGGKDRIVALPCAVADRMAVQMQRARLVAAEDRLNRLPVPLPGLYARKHPHAEFEERWCWFFPAREACRCPRTQRLVRWRCHEANVQRAMKLASRRAGVSITPHELRHAYATHSVRHGANVRDVQDALGHSSLETTMRYLTPVAMSVANPLDRLLTTPAPR